MKLKQNERRRRFAEEQTLLTTDARDAEHAKGREIDRNDERRRS